MDSKNTSIYTVASLRSISGIQFKDEVKSFSPFLPDATWSCLFSALAICLSWSLGRSQLPNPGVFSTQVSQRRRKTPHWRLLPSFAARQRLSWVGGHVPAPFLPLQRAHLQQGSPTRAFDGTNWSASAAGLRAGSSLSQAAQGKAGRSGRQQQRHQEPLKAHFCFSSIRDY